MRRSRLFCLNTQAIAFSAFALALVCVPALANGLSCKQDAFEAFRSLTSSGPFHYETRQMKDNRLLRETGSVVPGFARHVITHHSERGRNSQGIQIGTLAWTNDGSGWRPPVTTAQSILGHVPEFPFQITSARCGEIVDLDGRRLDSFEIEASPDGRQTLFVDAQMNLPVRLEHASSDEHLKVTTYRFDRAIRISAPAVDLEHSRRASLARFAHVIAEDEPSCRRNVLAAVSRVNTLGPFTFSVQGRLVAGITKITGTVVPPQAVHYELHGLTTHGGGNERIVIGTRLWDKVHDWQPVRLDGGYLKTFLARALPEAQNIARTRCLREGLLNGNPVAVYEFDLYEDTGLVRREVERRRLTVSKRTGVPLKIETLDGHGNVVRIEQRRYRSTLSIRPPGTQPSLPVRHARH